MRFQDQEAEQIALEFISAISSRLQSSVAATRLPLPEDEQERIEQLTDRLVGLRQTVIGINEALQAILRLAREDV
jgi:hypothetical protein